MAFGLKILRLLLAVLAASAALVGPSLGTATVSAACPVSTFSDGFGLG